MRGNRTARQLLMIAAGTMVALLCIGGGTWVVLWLIDVNAQAKHKATEREMRAAEAMVLAKVTPRLRKGGYLVSGRRVLAEGQAENPMALSSTSSEEGVAVAIDWTVTESEYAQISEGMSLEDVRAILDLSALRYIPPGPASRFTLVCSHPGGTVTLVFAGSPDVKLIEKSMAGSN